MTNYEARLQNTRKTVERLSKDLSERVAFTDKKYKVYDLLGLVRGFDTVEEVKAFLTEKVKKLLEIAEEDKKLFGYVLPCDVQSPGEAGIRVTSFYTIRY